jgi:coenzyme A diphosphatase NUDT7
MIENLQKMGKLEEKVPGGPDLADSDIKTAKIAALKSSGAKM